MLPRANRLKKSADFSKVFRRGYSAGNKTVVVHHLPAPSGEGSPLVGFVVSKKSLPRAVDRNLVKRRLRAVCAMRLQNFGEGTVTVIRAREKAKTASFRQLTSAVEQALARAQAKGKQ